MTMSGYLNYNIGMDITLRQQQILISLLSAASSLSDLLSKPTFSEVTERTLQRDLSLLESRGFIERQGKARAVTYNITSNGRLNIFLSNEALEKIFADENRPKVLYDFSRLDALRLNSLFTDPEHLELVKNNDIYYQKLVTAPKDIIKRERERITIELSWKSSQIEGNTYTLLETESLLKQNIPAKGKTEEETIMLLNHKKALEFSEQHKEFFKSKLTKSAIIDLHRILSEGIIDMGIRERLVGITGSVYRPLDNKFQVEEELGRLCNVVNGKDDIFEKALIAFTYICYLQPFNDGNKRTARILANAILFANDSFPLSLRAVDVNTYKLAILAYYELGILGNAKQIFLDQAEFAAENYAI